MNPSEAQQADDVTMPQEPVPVLPRIAVEEFAIALALGVSVHFLRKDRRTKRIIPFCVVGDRVLYIPERVRAAVLALEEGGAQLISNKRRRAT